MRQFVRGPVFKEAMKKRGAVRPIVWVKYGGVKMRSTWEVAFAERLDVLGCAWKYEPQQFDLGDGRLYTPDFWVRSPLGEAYVEVHRFERVKPGDEKKITKIHFARGVLPLPLVLIGDSDIARIKRENAIEDGKKPPELKP
jgi:predicted nuclease of restriction endonuclease-like RecB superfamily